MAKLIVDPNFLAKNPTAFTVIRNGNGAAPTRVALHGECTVELPAGPNGPARKVAYQGPTQENLRKLKEQGHKYVIEASEVDVPTPDAAKKQ